LIGSRKRRKRGVKVVNRVDWFPKKAGKGELRSSIALIGSRKRRKRGVKVVNSVDWFPKKEEKES
jgi:hypothetical protein